MEKKLNKKIERLLGKKPKIKKVRSTNVYNIDLLRLCFKQPHGLFENILGNHKIQQDGFYLLVNNIEEENPKNIICDVISNDGKKIGTIVFNSTESKYGRLCFFKLENEALYADVIHCIDFIKDDLGLEFVSVTELHIANDSTTNKIAKIMHHRRKYDKYEMILNRKRVDTSKQKLEGYKEVFQATRERRINPAIYIKQKKENAPLLCMYNKSIEIAEESGKQYIIDRDNFGNKIIYRSELRLKWDYIKDYFEAKGISGYNIFLELLLPHTIEAIFEHFTSRLVYFKNRENNATITLHNIA